MVLNEKVHPLKAGDYIHIPLGAKHRIRNPGDAVLVFVEVQTGSYFGKMISRAIKMNTIASRSDRKVKLE